MADFKVLVIFLLCVTYTLADDKRKSECLEFCKVVRCALPVCEKGYEIDYERCVPDSYSCCPRCVNETVLAGLIETRKADCLNLCTGVECMDLVCPAGYKNGNEICLPGSYSCCPDCVLDLNSKF